MDDLFRKLTVGVRFRPRDVSILKKQQAAQKEQREEQHVDIRDAKVSGDLDFFGGDNKQVAAADDRGKRGGKKAALSLKVPKKVLFESEEKVLEYRKKKGIRVYGKEVSAPIKNFVDLMRPLAKARVPLSLLECILSTEGISRPTPVQMQAIPIMVSGRDCFVVAPTGSGKTLVFVISILTRLWNAPIDDGRTVKAIIVSPTRELASQIRDEFRRFTPKYFTNDKQGEEKGGELKSGKRKGDRRKGDRRKDHEDKQKDGIQNKPSGQETREKRRKRHHLKAVLLNKAVLNNWRKNRPENFPSILVTTPMRLVQAVKEKLVDLSNVQQIVLDEADRLLEDGFMEQVDDILAACTCAEGSIQKVLFSATIPSGVEDLARSFMSDDPIRVVIGTPNAATETIEQRLVYVGKEEGKLMAIRQMLVQGIEPPVIIFTETIERATRLFHELIQHGINVEMIHSERSQDERERIISQFRAGRIWFLITTELLARGLDFPQVACVINYDFPLTTASYIHRIGRTGRAGNAGKAITLFTHDDADALRVVANVMKQSGCEVPAWMLKLQRKSNHHLQRDRSKKRKLAGAASGDHCGRT